MPNDFTIKFPKEDFQKLTRQIERAQKELGKSAKESLKWGVINVSNSIAASTRKSPKKRKVLKATPELLAKCRNVSQADRAIIEQNKGSFFGVMMYTQNGQEEFVLIEKLDRKLIPFNSKTTGERLLLDPKSGQVHRPEWWAATNKRAVKLASNLVNIRNAGLCKKVWSWISKNSRGMNSETAGVQWSSDGYAVRIMNKLRYAIDALGGKGMQPVETAMARAADSMAAKITRIADEQAKRITA